ncbi:hypothetical protein F5B19DRAFT_162520 [Rostrohypoxylon terebratum]|nr:hypothetical protein F5B19DRAFT_162520 [Rostrohypoxylon terebratum]
MALSHLVLCLYLCCYALAFIQCVINYVLHHPGIATEPLTMDDHIMNDHIMDVDDEKYKSPFYYCSICRDLQDSTDPVIMPCGHVFCSECIQQWLNIVKEQQRPQHCPYCRRQFKHHNCNHILSPKFLEPGVDLRSPCALWSFCITCWLTEALRRIFPIVSKIYWNVCALYPDEVREEPRIFQWLFTTLLLCEELRQDCFIMRSWVHKRDSVYLSRFKANSNSTDEPDYPEEWLPWDTCVPVLQREMNDLFLWVDVSDRLPTVACIERRDLDEFLAFKGKIQLFSQIYDKCAQVIDFV